MKRKTAQGLVVGDLIVVPTEDFEALKKTRPKLHELLIQDGINCVVRVIAVGEHRIAFAVPGTKPDQLDEFDRPARGMDHRGEGVFILDYSDNPPSSDFDPLQPEKQPANVPKDVFERKSGAPISTQTGLGVRAPFKLAVINGKVEMSINDVKLEDLRLVQTITLSVSADSMVTDLKLGLLVTEATVEADFFQIGAYQVPVDKSRGNFDFSGCRTVTAPTHETPKALIESMPQTDPVVVWAASGLESSSPQVQEQARKVLANHSSDEAKKVLAEWHARVALNDEKLAELTKAYNAEFTTHEVAEVFCEGLTRHVLQQIVEAYEVRTGRKPVKIHLPRAYEDAIGSWGHGAPDKVLRDAYNLEVTLDAEEFMLE